MTFVNLFDYHEISFLVQSIFVYFLSFSWPKGQLPSRDRKEAGQVTNTDLLKVVKPVFILFASLSIMIDF